MEEITELIMFEKNTPTYGFCYSAIEIAFYQGKIDRLPEEELKQKCLDALGDALDKLNPLLNGKIQTTTEEESNRHYLNSLDQKIQNPNPPSWFSFE